MAERQRDLKNGPGSEAQTARIGSRPPGEDASNQTSAEAREDKRRIGDPSSAADAAKREALEEAVQRATASVGEDEGRRDG